MVGKEVVVGVGVGVGVHKKLLMIQSLYFEEVEY